MAEVVPHVFKKRFEEAGIHDKERQELFMKHGVDEVDKTLREKVSEKDRLKTFSSILENIPKNFPEQYFRSVLPGAIENTKNPSEIVDVASTFMGVTDQSKPRDRFAPPDEGIEGFFRYTAPHVMKMVKNKEDAERVVTAIKGLVEEKNKLDDVDLHTLFKTRVTRLARDTLENEEKEEWLDKFEMGIYQIKKDESIDGIRN